MLDNIRESSQSLWVKIAFGIIIVVFVFWGIGTYTPNAGLVASVNGQDITEQEFFQAYNMQVEQLQRALPDLQLTEEMLKGFNIPHYALEALITQTLLEQEAKRTGFEVGAKELLDTISTFAFAQDASGNFSLEEYLQVFQDAGQSPKAFEAILQKELREAKFRSLFSEFAFISEEQAKAIFEYQYKARNFDGYFIADSNFINNVQVSNEDLEALYQQNISMYQVPANVKLEYIAINSQNLSRPNDITEAEIDAEYQANRALYDLPETVTASHILISVPSTANAQVEEEAFAKIKDIENRINNGTSFANLAREFSDDPGSASRGGSLGAFTRGQMVAEFEEVAFSTAKGKVSAPVRSDFGYHLIFVEDKQEAGPRDKNTTRQMIIADLAQAKAITSVQTVTDSILVQIHADKNVNLQEIANKEGLKVENTALMSVDMLANELGISYTDAQILGQTAVNTVLDSPLMTENAYLIVKVVESEPSRVLSLEEVKDSLMADAKSIAAHKKAFEKAQESLQNPSSIPNNQIKSYQMARNGIFPLGNSPELALDVFAAAEDSSWLANPYALENGYIIAKPTNIIPANPSLWTGQKETQMAHMQSSRENVLFSLYLRQLRAEADIKILNQAYFQ